MSEKEIFQVKGIVKKVEAEFLAGAVYFNFVGEIEVYVMSEELFRRLFWSAG